MPGTNLQGMKVAILVTDHFEQVELTEPKKALEDAGATTAIVSVQGTVQGVHHAEMGDVFPVDLSLEEARPEDFDAVLLPGGALNADFLRVQPKAQDFIGRMDAAEKPIAVICHGAWLLASAGITRGRRMTSYHTIQDDLRNAGADWIDAEVVRDRNWVSSRQPKDIPAFNNEMIALFAETRQRP